MRLMFQSLLADRFKMVAHRVTNDVGRLRADRCKNLGPLCFSNLRPRPSLAARCPQPDVGLTSIRVSRIEGGVTAKVIATSRYERAARRLLADAERSAMELAIATDPEAHPVVPGNRNLPIGEAG